MNKNILLLGAVSILGFAGCHKQVAETEPATEATPRPAVAPPARPVTDSLPPVATPEPNHFAPEGVFYLTAKVSVETSDGIVGFPPGTKITREASGGYVTAQNQKIAPRPDQMTNDLRIAERVAGQDAATQAAVKKALAARAAEIKAHADAAAAASVDQAARNAPAGVPASDTPSRPAASSSTSLGGGASLGSSSSLGAAHTKTKNGWLWQKDAAGQWVPVKPL